MSIQGEKGSFFVGLLIVIGICSGIFYVVPEATIGQLARFLTVDETPDRADAIVVLLNPGAPSRTIKAAELYQAGLAPRIIVARGADRLAGMRNVPSGFKWPRSSKVVVDGLRSLGVAEHAIELVSADKAFDTANELAAVAKYMASGRMGRVILVTNKSHTRRTDWIWSRVGRGIDRDTVAAPQPGFERWWESGPNTKALAYEYLALVKESYYQLKAVIKR